MKKVIKKEKVIKVKEDYKNISEKECLSVCAVLTGFKSDYVVIWYSPFTNILKILQSRIFFILKITLSKVSWSLQAKG